MGIFVVVVCWLSFVWFLLFGLRVVCWWLCLWWCFLVLIVALCLFGFAWLFRDCVGCWVGLHGWFR